MSVIGIHCSHEQINPAQLLRDVQRAERAGFTAAVSSDHLSPWSERQGESGFAWSFPGAALATTQLPFGVVNAPGQRYHPAIIAHDQWRSNVFAPPVCWDLETVEAFDVISDQVSTEQVRESVRVSSDLEQHAEWLQEYVDQGWDELYLHFVGKFQAPSIDAFGEHVLPQLTPTAPHGVLA